MEKKKNQRSKLKLEMSVYALFFAAVVMLQWASGTFKSEFGGHPDEAAHYITGLMVRDFISSLHWTDPMKFAENYYIHYPKVAIGHWPPFFYVVQAVWTLLFSPSHVSVLLLMALLTTLLAITIYRVIQSEFGSLLGITMGLLLIALPLIQQYSGMVMAEIPLALFTFWAVLYFGRYLDRGRWQDIISFGIFASLAILTKGNSWALAFVPPIALLLSGRFELLTRLSFWASALLVLGLCGPWYWFTRDMVRNAMMEKSLTLSYTNVAIGYYLWHLITITGIGLSILIAIGLFVQVIIPCRSGGTGGKWAASGALLVSVWGFHCVVPAAFANRYLISAIPSLLVFLAVGIAWTADRLPLHRLTPSGKTAILVLASSLIFVGETFSIPRHSSYGFAEVAQDLLSSSDFQKSVFLVSSDARGEGMFISQVAMRERRPRHVVLRGSKVLSESGWNEEEYTTLYKTPKEVMNYLDRIPVGIVVVDMSILVEKQRVYHRQLVETIESYPQRWELLGSYPAMRRMTEYPKALRVYRLVGHENKPLGTIRVSVDGMLNQTLELKRQ